MAVATALLTACVACTHAGADKASSGPTVPTEPAPTTTTNPYAVPPVIDTAYVNRVLAGLDAVAGDALRIVYQSGSLPPAVLARLKAIYAAPSALQLYLDGLQIDLQSGFKSYRPQIGNRSSLVVQLVTGQSDCIFASVHRDYSAIGTDPSAVVNPQWVGLTRSDPTKDPDHYNITSWSYTYDGFTSDRTQPQNPCVH